MQIFSVDATIFLNIFLPVWKHEKTCPQKLLIIGPNFFFLVLHRAAQAIWPKI